MNTIANDIREAAKSLAGWLRHEPAIRPNLRAADHITTAAVIAVLIEKGLDRTASIYTYLAGRDCPHDYATVQFILDAYDGGDWRHHVWRRNKAGRYTMLSSVSD